MSVGSTTRERVFVVWDTSSTTLRINLEALQARPELLDAEVVVPGEGGRGRIHDIVLEGIRDADRVLVLTGRPNANVGFEAGLAWGMGKPVLFAYHGKRLPPWTRIPPFKNYIQQGWSKVGELREMMGSPDLWLAAGRPAPTLPADGPCLDLCPAGGLGEALREARDALELVDWIRPEEVARTVSLADLDRTFGEVARLVWTIVDSDDERDGGDNAANGVLAGWFYSRCLSSHDTPFWVLRLEEARDVVDVELVEDTFAGLAQYTSLITDRIEEHWQSRAPAAAEAEEPSAGPVRIAVLPFENRSDHEHGDGFSMGLTLDLIEALKRNPQLDLPPTTSILTAARPDVEEAHVASRLDVTYLVRGSLTQKGSQCLLEVRVFRTGHERPLRSYRRRVPWDDILNNSAVEQIVQEISSGVDRKLSFDIHLPRHDGRAKELYWRGIQDVERFNNTRDPTAAREARRLLQDAFVKDASYEEARLQLGFLDLLRWETTGDLQLLHDSLDIFRSVLEREPRNPQALSEVGYIRYVLGENRVSAVGYVLQALEAHPEDMIANNVLALLCLYLGYYESNVEIETTKVLVSDPAYLYPLTNAGLAYQLAGDHVAALEMARRALDIDPRAFVGLALEGAQHFYAGRFEEAGATWRRGYERYEETDGAVRSLFEVLLAWIMARKGDGSAASTTLAASRGSGWTEAVYGPYYASLCALCGEVDEAVELLGRAPTFAGSYRYLISEPTLRGLADAPSFRELLERRHREWEADLSGLREHLPVPPPELPSPRAWLEDPEAWPPGGP